MSLLDCIPIAKPVRTTATLPTLQQEPVSLLEAKKQCGIAEAFTFFDAELVANIVAAREMVENDTGLICYTGTFTQQFTDWGTDDIIVLADVRPVTSITSIVYLDTDGNSQTLATSVYQLETGNVKQFIRLKYNQSWPAIRGDINGITITYVAGFASVLSVPLMVKKAMLFLITHWYEQKGIVSLGTISPDVSMTYEAIIDRLSRRTYP